MDLGGRLSSSFPVIGGNAEYVSTDIGGCFSVVGQACGNSFSLFSNIESKGNS